jgi:hypothetical protein
VEGCAQLVDNFRVVAEISLGSGKSFLFWSDNWKVNGDHRPVKDRFPRLFSFILRAIRLSSVMFLLSIKTRNY